MVRKISLYSYTKKNYINISDALEGKLSSNNKLLAQPFLKEILVEWNLYSEPIIDTAIEEDIEKQKKYLEVLKREGYPQYKKSIINSWGKQCVITGVKDIDNLIEIAHIKPWSQCSEQDSINPSNGLPLSAHIHKLFDAGYITISPQGKIKYSKDFPAESQNILGLINIESIQSNKLNSEHKNFLEWHNENIFRD